MSTVLFQAPATYRGRSTSTVAGRGRAVSDIGVYRPAGSGVGARARLRMTSRGRRVLLALASVPLVVGALMFALNAGGAAASGHVAHGQFDYVTVQSGQSLWAIAEKVAPSADPRDVIANIVALNQLEGGVVTPGERLAIPTQYEAPTK